MRVVKTLNDYISEAEKIFIGDKTFNQERIDFIKNLQTCDLLAVPGSGKTTSLLAKLYCISKSREQFQNKGILVLAHTNAAVEEIEKKLKPYCPELFNYPNFVGTLQGFINKYLANQANSIKYNSRIQKNDDEIYKHEVTRFFNNLQWAPKNSEVKYLKNKLFGKALLKSPEGLTFNEKIDLTVDYIFNLKFDFIARKFIYGDKGTTLYKYGGEASDAYLELEAWKEDLLKNGLLSYSDSYYLAKWYLQYNPLLKEQLQLRFSYVFVDEMQDLDSQQINIIDDIFFNGKTVIQRIGDINQAIYNSGKAIKTECDWITRQTSYPDKYIDIYLNGSNRLTKEIATLVDGFTLDDKKGKFTVLGKRILDIKPIPPHLIVYNVSNMAGLKQKFRDLITEQQQIGNIPKSQKDPFKIIGWNSEWDDADASKGRIRLKDIFPEFSKEQIVKKDDFKTLSEYLHSYDVNKKTMESARKSILNALIQILRLDNKKIADVKNQEKIEKFYTKRSMIDSIKNYKAEEAALEAYHSFTLKIYEWCFDLLALNKNEIVFDSIKKFINGDFSLWFGLSHSPATRAFLKSFKPLILKKIDNEHNNTLPIEIGTVHSAKGQTHCATMYIETSYYDYETNKIKDRKPFYMQKHACKNPREKETLKMLYVGFSRPSHLLCFAVLEDNLKNGDLKLFEDAGWKIC